MLLEFASPILLFLILLHAMVGYVELGTDSWITNITGTILKQAATTALMLFIWTSGLMFILRLRRPHRPQNLAAGPAVLCAVLGCIGLMLLGRGRQLRG